MKKKLLYVMSVDWGWIVQRPHLLVAELEKDYEVTVLFQKPLIKRWKSQKELEQPKNARHSVCFPYQDRIRLLNTISEISFKNAIKDVDQYDVVWIGAPLLYRFFMDYKGKIIYDCMDNYPAFIKNEKAKQETIHYEKLLIHRADLVIATSTFLKEKIDTLGAEQSLLVRNGYRRHADYPLAIAKRKESYTIGYIGTVSEWIDFSALEHIAGQMSDVCIHLIGPASGYEMHAKPNLVFDGVVEHSRLYEFIKSYDCLIMPFVINDIILAVDPVKLYEYISFGKCIISVYYDEIARFEPYVYFYHNEEELVELVKCLKEQGFKPKYSNEQRERFLADSTWEQRGVQIREEMRELWSE